VPSVFSGADDERLGARLAARTLELIDIPSESRQEAALHAHLLGVLRDGGVSVRDAGDTCLIAELPGPPDAPVVVLAGHLDTVPAQGNRPGRIDGDAVIGLGASDMLGAVALMTEAALHAGDAPLRASVLVVLFGREELPVAESSLTPLLGREPLLRGADLALVMEPTDNAVQAGCLGNINARWSFHGVSAHSARPWQGDNAIERAAAGIARLAAAAPPDHRTLDGLDFTEVVSVTRISGGIADNVVPDRVDCHVNYRYAPDRPAADADARLHELCGGDAETLEITSNAPSAPVAVTHPLVQQLIAAGELAVGPKQAWTPVAEFAAVGVPAVNFGPGDPAYAHKVDEQVAVGALVRGARTLECFLCG
jgi:succinyl-diaminopimelate desuccinylase